MTRRICSVILLAAVLSGLAAGCGKTTQSGDGTQATITETTGSEASTAGSDNGTTGATQPAQAESAEETIPPPDTKANADKLVGSWTDISSDDRFAKITKTDTGYQYEDNDGKYPAEFKDGVLKVKVTDSDTADVYLDEKTGHMFTAYMGDTLEYSKQ